MPNDAVSCVLALMEAPGTDVRAPAESVYAPSASGDTSSGRRLPASGARILLLSLGLATVLPQIIGFFSAFFVPLLAGPPRSPLETTATVLRILGFNTLVFAAALSAAPFGVRRLIRGSRGGPAMAPLWIRLGAPLLTSAFVILAWVSGVRRFLQGSQPVPSYELFIALATAEAVTLFAIALLLRYLSPAPTARPTRALALATMVLVTLHLMCFFLLGLVGDPVAGALTALIALVKWGVFFGLLWSARALPAPAPPNAQR